MPNYTNVVACLEKIYGTNDENLKDIKQLLKASPAPWLFVARKQARTLRER